MAPASPPSSPPLGHGEGAGQRAKPMLRLRPSPAELQVLKAQLRAQKPASVGGPPPAAAAAVVAPAPRQLPPVPRAGGGLPEALEQLHDIHCDVTRRRIKPSAERFETLRRSLGGLQGDGEVGDAVAALSDGAAALELYAELIGRCASVWRPPISDKLAEMIGQEQHASAVRSIMGSIEGTKPDSERRLRAIEAAGTRRRASKNAGRPSELSRAIDEMRTKLRSAGGDAHRL